MAKYLQEGERIAVIVESECRDDGEFLYYVSYIDCNRRMDTWLQAHAVRVTDGSQATGAFNNQTTLAREQQHVDPSLPDEEDEYKELFPNDEHKGMDQKQVEEHYNSTKLKTIHYVNLGLRFRISTWYYSPYPSEF